MTNEVIKTDAHSRSVSELLKKKKYQIDGYDEFDVAWQLSAERAWMVPAYTLPPNAQDVTIMRALVKETLSREHVDTLARDIEEACDTLAKKGGAHESERKMVVTGPCH